MEKVYLIELECVQGFHIRTSRNVAGTKEKAQKILKEWALEEERTSWINLYHKDDFDVYELDDDYFYALCENNETHIIIKEMEVL